MEKITSKNGKRALRNGNSNYSNMGVGRIFSRGATKGFFQHFSRGATKGFFQHFSRGATKGFFQHFSRGDTKGFFQHFSRGSQKWWDLLFTARNWKKQSLLLKFSTSPPLPPFQRPCTVMRPKFILPLRRKREVDMDTDICHRMEQNRITRMLHSNTSTATSRRQAHTPVYRPPFSCTFSTPIPLDYFLWDT